MRRVIALIAALTLAAAGCTAPPPASGEGLAQGVASAQAQPDQAKVVAPVVGAPVEVVSSDPSVAMPEPETPPTGLRVDRLGIDMPVTAVGLDGSGDMEIPSVAATAGWYRYGPGFDAPRGHVVLAAHVDDVRGLGPFASLRDAREGDLVTLTAADGARDYVIQRVEQTAKTQVDLDQVFSRDGDPALVLVTCGGSFDWGSRHYADNVIVWAVPAEVSS